jgi:hypothetical protein
MISNMNVLCSQTVIFLSVIQNTISQYIILSRPSIINTGVNVNKSFASQSYINIRVCWFKWINFVKFDFSWDAGCILKLYFTFAGLHIKIHNCAWEYYVKLEKLSSCQQTNRIENCHYQIIW